MKEIGQSFKEAREKIEITKEEVIKDLNITMGQLDNLEDGNANAFKDVFFLKDLVKKYAKYLNLDEDEIMSLFNDFIFGYTSRIPVDDILEQTREINIIERKNNADKISSPYTKTKKESNLKYIVLYTSAVILLIVLVFLIVAYFNNREVSNAIIYNIIERRA
jgi:cytoskeletal protein RodZ